MATLSGTVLSNCYYIPDFIASGTKMMFENASAPTSWTKDVTYNNASLRVVNGTVGNRVGTVFTTILASSPVSGTVSSVQSGVTINPVASAISINANPFNSPGSTSSNATGSSNHTHPYTNLNENFRLSGAAPRISRFTTISSSVGEGGQHSHGIDANPHTHPFSNPSHTHTLTEANHDHTFTSTAQNFAVSYRDVILATKD